MLMLRNLENKNKDQLLIELQQKNNCEIENIFINIYEKEQGLFKSKKYVAEYITKAEILDLIKEFMNKLSYYMNIDIKYEIYFETSLIKIILFTSNNNIIIGKDGKTLNSIQLLIRQYLKNLQKFNVKILVDVNEYKKNHQKKLEKQINEMCKELQQTKLEIKLDPMNSYERRIVHSIVKEYEHLTSKSYGEDPNRYTIIRYKD